MPGRLRRNILHIQQHRPKSTLPNQNHTGGKGNQWGGRIRGSGTWLLLKGREKKLCCCNRRLKEKAVTRQQAAHTATQWQLHTNDPETWESILPLLLHFGSLQVYQNQKNNKKKCVKADLPNPPLHPTRPLEHWQGCSAAADCGSC